MKIWELKEKLRQILKVPAPPFLWKTALEARFGTFPERERIWNVVLRGIVLELVWDEFENFLSDQKISLEEEANPKHLEILVSMSRRFFLDATEKHPILYESMAESRKYYRTIVKAIDALKKELFP